MKTLLSTLLVLISFSSFAYGDFSPIAICGNRALVVDSSSSVSRAGRAGQIVVKNKQILDYLLDTHAIITDQINAKGELIIAGTILNNGSFLKGAISIGDKQVSVDRVGTSSLKLQISENNYPRLTLLAEFTFNDCHM